MVQKMLPLGQTESLLYNPDGTLSAMTDYNGHLTTYGYDANGRQNRVTHDDGTGVSTLYNPDGSRQSATRTLSGGGTVVTSDQYNSLGQLAQVTTTQGSTVNTLSYTYDDVGSKASVTSPGGTTSYLYDADNRLASVWLGSSEVSSYTYDHAGNRLSLTRANGVSTQYAYDAQNRLTDLLNSVGSSYHYTLDLSGKRVALTDSDGTTTYGYDADGRLTNESGPAGTHSYGYDAVGNRTSLDSTNYAYDANDRNLAYNYDANGNQTSVGGQSATYDAENHLLSAGTSSYAYDADGNRVQATVGGVTTNYVVDTTQSFPQVIEERDGSNSLLARYVFGDDLIRMDRGGISSYYVFDGLGSTRALTNASGQVTDTWAYDAFGNETHTQGSTANPFLFNGQEQDASGLYYLRARYYNPADGRFVSQDPYGGSSQDPISLHRYLYASDDPVNSMDPGGQDDLMSMVVAMGNSMFLAATRLTYIHLGVSVAIGLVDPGFAQFMAASEGFNPVWAGEDVIGADVGQGARALGELLDMDTDSIEQELLPQIENFSKDTAEELRQQCWNLRQALGDEIDGGSRFADGEGNVAVANLRLDGEAGAEQFISTSSKTSFNVPGMVNVSNTQMFAGQFNQFHSETKILQRIYNQYGDTNLTGELTMYSERQYCGQCRTAIAAFSAKYPNLKVNLLTSNLPFNVSSIPSP